MFNCINRACQVLENDLYSLISADMVDKKDPHLIRIGITKDNTSGGDF